MMLSKAGKEVLIKAIVQAIPTYTMGVFQLPVKLCDELNSLCAKFWWGQVGNENWAESSNRSGRQQARSALWKLKILGKIKIFGWRACHDILPTRVNLAKPKIVPKDSCHCCKSAPEDAIHAIWGCGAAQDVWVGSLNMLQKF